MQKIVTDLFISADEFKKIYAGTASVVSARSRDGRTIRFPANILRPYLTHTGISGSFLIEFDDDNRFQAITLLSS